MHDIHNEMETRKLVDVTRQTNADTAIVSEIIDLQGIHACELIVSYGQLTDTNATVTALLEESNDSGMSVKNAVADADLLGTEAGISADATADDGTVKKLGYKGIKRYIRLTLTPSGNNSGNIDVSAVAVLMHKSKK